MDFTNMSREEQRDFILRETCYSRAEILSAPPHRRKEMTEKNRRIKTHDKALKYLNSVPFNLEDWRTGIKILETLDIPTQKIFWVEEVNAYCFTMPFQIYGKKDEEVHHEVAFIPYWENATFSEVNDALLEYAYSYFRSLGLYGFSLDFSVSYPSHFVNERGPDNTVIKKEVIEL